MNELFTLLWSSCLTLQSLDLLSNSLKLNFRDSIIFTKVIINTNGPNLPLPSSYTSMIYTSYMYMYTDTNKTLVVARL